MVEGCGRVIESNEEACFVNPNKDPTWAATFFSHLGIKFHCLSRVLEGDSVGWICLDCAKKLGYIW